MTEKFESIEMNKNIYGTVMIPQNYKKNQDNIPITKLKKCATVISYDYPDVLNDNNPNVFRAEKLTNFRKSKKHMSQLPPDIDKPDVLFGQNEIKEVKPYKRFHSIKKLTSSKSSPDFPDTLAPIEKDYYHHLPRPESMCNIRKSKKEECKNPEKNNLSNKEKPSIEKNEKDLNDIKDRKDETDAMKTDENKDNTKNEIEKPKEEIQKIESDKILDDKDQDKKSNKKEENNDLKDSKNKENIL